ILSETIANWELSARPRGRRSKKLMRHAANYSRNPSHHGTPVLLHRAASPPSREFTPAGPYTEPGAALRWPVGEDGRSLESNSGWDKEKKQKNRRLLGTKHPLGNKFGRFASCLLRYRRYGVARQCRESPAAGRWPLPRGGPPTVPAGGAG